MTEHDPAVDGWELALGELEAHVSLAERTVRAQLAAGPADRTTDWTAPTELGPIPDEFVFRARQLLHRQQALIDAIPGILATNADRRRVLGRIHDATGLPTPSVYVDVAT